jgi:LmbE family N-acetylglucosaminyl deacetylase
MEDGQTILIVSYFACMPGACQAEWLDDKVDSLVRAGHRVGMVTATCAQRHGSDLVTHWRVPSISRMDFSDELNRIRERGEKVPLEVHLMWPAVLTLGVVADMLQRVVTSGVGDGRWSWTLTATIGVLGLVARIRPDLILTTGGPPSAHLAGLIAARLTRRPVIVELQDPLSGENIGRNPHSSRWLQRIEALLVRLANKTVYVTKAAAGFAARQFRSNSVQAVYPGARRFDVAAPGGRLGGAFRLVHLGSLYSTRNFVAITAAIDSLVAAGGLRESDIELINLGHVSPEIRAKISSRSYVRIMPPVSRIEALEFAAGCDVALLIQNSDERSRVTIPYKTYDYLNLGNRVLALLNSDELTELLEQCGHVAVPLSDVPAITRELERLLRKAECGVLPEVRIDPVHQARALIDLTGRVQPAD